MVSNLINCVKALQDFGIEVIGLSEHSDQTIDQLSLSEQRLYWDLKKKV